ncbi:anti-sigma factor family protein, partial [Corynebacterium diphtheriae]|uniref:anti-sigma factor family protein n=1 Tax=Corynebacterium diphtheriae TaxID=1717 RepID=UPI003BF91A1A
MKKEHSPKNKVRHFASVEHLNPEAVAAFVDNELSPAAAHRAKIHLVHCPECREEIHRQRGGAPPRGGGPPPRRPQGTTSPPARRGGKGPTGPT